MLTEWMLNKLLNTFSHCELRPPPTYTYNTYSMDCLFVIDTHFPLWIPCIWFYLLPDTPSSRWWGGRQERVIAKIKTVHRWIDRQLLLAFVANICFRIEFLLSYYSILVCLMSLLDTFYTGAVRYLTWMVQSSQQQVDFPPWLAWPLITLSI